MARRSKANTLLPSAPPRLIPLLGAAIAAVLLLAPSAPAQVVAESIGDGVVRFWESPEAAASDHFSFALREQARPIGPAPADFPVAPVFSTIDGDVSVRIDIDPGTSLYGTGMVSGPLLRNGRTVVCWNTDAYGYDDSTPSLYQSHPWVLAVRADGTAFGALADTTWRCEVNLEGGIRFTAEGPSYPLIVIDRDSPQGVVTALADLTGTMELPPKWALGYQQCRYSYYPDDRVREVARGFRERDIPCDVIWVDIDYMDGYRCFTFDPEGFPDPAGLNAELHGMGFRAVWMIDPGLKAEPGYFAYDQGTAGEHWVKRADGSVYKGEVWPGMCVFPDFTRRETRRWWAALYDDFLAHGIDGVWNDMNEPAVFNVPTKTMPEDNVHRGFGGGPHARFHNVYGMLMAEGTLEGFRRVYPGRRPFVLSRANYIGGHRYAAAWTGDNTAIWYDLEISVPMALNLGLSGQPFAGPDIGGFVGNGTPELFARWMGFGAMLPFARGHTGKGNVDKEPWAFGPEVERTCRLAIERRYRLMPYYYTLFHEASRTGLPVARPVFFADPRDPALRSEDDAFLLGDDVLIAPQLVPSRDRVAVMPRGIWREFDFADGDDPDLPGMYLRGGSVVPAGPVMQHVDEKPLDPLTLLVCLDEHGFASGVLYEDAGDGYGYLEGEYLLTTYVAERSGGDVVVRIAAEEGRMPRPARRVVVRLFTDGGEFRAQGRDGAQITVRLP